ncbi:4886_t:CDS:2 [Paraglomus occultum]|uniref:4886_t:CDS:1 n=1 Tax=Paraglomus occultum TaxID=144539 RepID=A0A9N9BIN4_9GLOM|nr:4886_t:CDS:2 [Paraglomus occultum]
MNTFSKATLMLLSILFLFAFISPAFAISDEALALLREDCQQQAVDPAEYGLGLHIAALFVILFTSSLGAFIPVTAKRYPSLRIPKLAFFVAKHFGTGVILATAFIHILPSAFSRLNSYCLDPIWWDTYPSFPGAFAMIAALGIFVVEYVATTMVGEGHSHSLPKPASADANANANGTTSNTDDDKFFHCSELAVLSSNAQSLGIIILEAGICFHSVIIGMDLSVSTGSDFTSLWIALVFHQLFEGLGLGSRIAELHDARTIKPWILSFLYGTTTPLGIAIGIGVRFTYDANSPTSLLIQGILDSLSAGILLYTALVQLIASDFIIDPYFRKQPKSYQVSAFALLLFGALIMSLIGRWA